MDVVEFSVGEQTGAADAAQNIARFAFDAGLIRIDRAPPLARGFALLDEQDIEIGMLAQIIGGKQTGRSAADHYHVVLVFSSGCRTFFRHWGSPP